MLDAAHTLEGAVDHDGEAVTQGLTLLHTVGGEDHRPPVLNDLCDTVPQEAAGLGVHARRRLVLGKGIKYRFV